MVLANQEKDENPDKAYRLFGDCLISFYHDGRAIDDPPRHCLDKHDPKIFKNGLPNYYTR